MTTEKRPSSGFFQKTIWILEIDKDFDLILILEELEKVSDFFIQNFSWKILRTLRRYFAGGFGTEILLEYSRCALFKGGGIFRKFYKILFSVNATR